MHRFPSARPRTLKGAFGVLSPLVLSLFCAGIAQAVDVPPDSGKSAPVRAFVAPEFHVQPELEATTTLDASASGIGRAAAADFAKRNPGHWEMRWDNRSDRPNLIQGAGIPLVPGRGNKLDAQKLGLAAVDLSAVEARLLDFVRANRALLKTDGLEFQLDANSSTSYGKGNTHWFVEFAQSKNGVRVQGANLFFRVSNGNVVQFGSHLVAPVDIDTQPVSSSKNAFELVLRELDLPAKSRISEIVEPGELLILPYASDKSGAGETFRGARGTGYAHALAWRFVFRVEGEPNTFEVLADAKTNRVIEVRDLTLHVNATVDGGVFLGINTGPETIVALPFAAVTNGSAKVTDALGIYDYSGGSATVTLDGKYFTMSDKCGSISLSTSAGGNLSLGTDTGTDCGSTSAPGGAGNTRASRTGFYYLTKINRKAATFLPNNSWIASKVTANMNVNNTCNATWNGTSMNFYKSGAHPSDSSVQCANTGELPAVFLHEWGHGMDQNSGGGASENGSGEAVGDTFAFLETKDACIGNGFFTTRNGCYNCDTSCTGVRDLKAFSLQGARTIARPSTIADDNGPNCDRLACPYTEGLSAYQGPMGYQGHCESYIAGSANWDLAQALVAQYGATAGYAQMDKIWYGSLTASKSAYRVASGGKCNVNAVVDGCGSNNWYTVYLAADDNDGNLANGTPNACRIWDAFNAHGIACGTRPTCTTGGGGNTNVPPVANFAVATNGLTATFTDSSTDSDGTIASRTWNFGDGGTSTATNPSRTYAAAGTYNVTLTATDNSGAMHSKTTAVTVTAPPGGGGNELQNGVARTGLSAAAGAFLSYTLVVPAGATNLKFVTAGGTGDADLYVRFGSAPTTSTYTCRSNGSSNAETCTISAAQAGTYHVRVQAYRAFSGLSLTGSYTP